MIFVNPSQIGANPVVTCGDGLALNDGCVEDWLWICNDNGWEYWSEDDFVLEDWSMNGNGLADWHWIRR